MSVAEHNAKTSKCDNCNQTSSHTTCLTCAEREFRLTARLVHTVLQGRYSQIANRSAKTNFLETCQKNFETEAKDLREEAAQMMKTASICLGEASSDTTNSDKKAGSTNLAGFLRDTIATVDDDGADGDQLKYWNGSTRRHIADMHHLLERAEAADGRACSLKQVREIDLPDLFRREDKAWNECLSKSRELYGHIRKAFGPVCELMTQIEKKCSGNLEEIVEGDDQVAGASAGQKD